MLAPFWAASTSPCFCAVERPPIIHASAGGIPAAGYVPGIGMASSGTRKLDHVLVAGPG